MVSHILEFNRHPPLDLMIIYAVNYAQQPRKMAIIHSKDIRGAA